MKKGILLTAIGLALVVLVTAVTTKPPVAANAANTTGTTAGKITVTAVGTVKAKPDIATVSLGVVTTAKEADAAQSENTTRMNAVVDALKAHGIAEDDIKTGYYYMYPQYDYSSAKSEPAITGYNVSNTVIVTIRNIESVGSVIDKAVSAGANNANSVTFGVTDITPYYNKALTQAINSGKAKANSIASALGVTVSQPLEVNEIGGYTPTYAEAGGMMNAKDMGGGTPITPGTIEVTANLQMIFGY